MLQNEPEPAPVVETSFDDVNLNDDKGAPKLDLDLGLDNKTAGTGGWGSGWGSGGGATGGSSWGFGATDDKADDMKVAGDE